MRKSKRSIRRIILSEILKHLKSEYDFELTLDAARDLLYSNAGVEMVLSFRSDSCLDDLQAALARLESGTFGICIACKHPIARAHLDNDVTRRVCPSCEAEFNHRRPEAVVSASLAREV
jgi:RNA polymerase-binding transcription factor DksA